MRLRLPLASLLVVTAFLGGCASATPGDGPDGADQPTESASDGVPTVVPSCALASATVIAQTLNISVSEPTQVSTDEAIVCNYTPADGSHSVIIRFSTGEDKASFARGREKFDSSGQPTTDVPGLVDEAYVSSVEFEDFVTNTMVARKGPVELTIVAVASIDAEKALVGKVFGALG